MSTDYAQSVFVVSSSDSAHPTFGTAFVVSTSKTIDTVVTCAHLVLDLPANAILVGGRHAEIFKIGQSDGIDLAVLRIPNDGQTVPLVLGLRPKADTECTVAAFDQLAKAASLRVISGRIGGIRTISQRRTGSHASAWELNVSSQLNRGNSGAPVIDVQTGLVVGILSYRLNELQDGLAIASENLAHIWHEAPLRDARPSATPDKSAADTYAVQINFDPWLLLLQRSHLAADRLLLEAPPHADDSPFLRFEDFLNVADAADLQIVKADGEPTRLRGAREFRVALLTNLVRATDSCMKWAVAKTVEILRRESVIDDESVLSAVWQNLCGGSRATEEIEKVLYAMFNEMRENNYKKHERVYEFVMFLMDHVVQPDVFSVIARKLREHDESLGNDAPPAYLERIKRLYGQATARDERDRTGPRLFDPEVALIPSGDICPYDLEAMIFPVTVGEHARLTGRNVPGAITTLPYVFEFQTNQGPLFNVLSSEVTSFVNLCNDFNEQKQYVWDLPTICEWLALAGCERDQFPWGEKQPSADRANLAFTRHRRVKPVGTFPRGMSRHKTLDCCGNVHEIVISLPEAIFHPGGFPHSYRLVGGCFSTPPSHASCHIVRPFRPKEQEDHRKNVGLRLIRFSRHDYPRRKKALEQFLASDHRAAQFRAAARST